MARFGFDDGWGYRTPLGPFAAAQGADVEVRPVTLPHDALRDADRAPDAPGRGASAYYPPGNYTYCKTFDAPAEWAGRLVALEFSGAMRHAMVFVNDEFAGNRADGYARFFVDVTPFLRFGAANEVRVEVRTGQDSRWYSGAGLHRSVVLHVDEPVHITPDGVRVTTLDLEPDQAVVEVATTVRNASLLTASTLVTTSVTDADGVRVEGDSTPVTVPPGGGLEKVATRSKPSVPASSASKNAMVEGNRAGSRVTEPHTRGEDSTTRSTVVSCRASRSVFSTESTPNRSSCSDP